MSELVTKVNETISVIREKSQKNYPIGIVLGTGLGGLVDEIDIDFQIDYSNLPHFVQSTVE